MNQRYRGDHRRKERDDEFDDHPRGDRWNLSKAAPPA